MLCFKTTSLLLVGILLSQASAKPRVVTSFSEAFIVEADASHGPLKESFLDNVSEKVSGLGAGCRASSRRRFNSPHFSGASFDLECNAKVNRAAALQAIQSLGEVGSSWPVGRVQASASIPREGRGTAPSKRYAGGIIGRRDGRIIPGGADPSATLSTHVMGNVDRMHAAGFTGDGIRIAVVDSGFDTTVPAFAQTKIAYTLDTTNNSTNVNDNCTMHGTHVLGIVAAKSTDNMFGVSGVARDATFELYKIEACNSRGAQTDDLLAAFLTAADRGVDVITCSYGGNGGFADGPYTTVVDRIARNGTFVSLAAGNGGPGPFTGANPSTAEHVTAVGSADNTRAPCVQWRGSWRMGSNTEDLSVTPGQNMSFPDTELTVWSPSKMETNERPSNCSLVQTDPPKDLANTIVLLKRGGQCWVDSEGVDILLSAQYNLTYALWYNVEAPEGQPERCPPYMEADAFMSGIATTNHATGSSIQAELTKGGSVKVMVPSSLANSRFTLSNPKSNTPGLLSAWSSWGPSFEGRSMPSVVAPGGFILSAFPARIGNWGMIDGTSMSTPYLAGVAALVKQYNRKLTGTQIRAKLTSTARPINYNDRYGPTVYAGETQNFFASVLHQGGGLVDAWAAAHTRTLLNVSSLSFNDTAHRPAHLSFEISNTGDEELIYNISHIGAASGFFMNTTGGAKYNLSGNQGIPDFARLKFDPQSVRVGPGKTASVTVSVAAEPKLEGGVSFFGGYVALNVSTTTAYAESLRLPYTGFKGNLATLPMIDRDRTYGGTYDLTSGNLERIEPQRAFTCVYNSTAYTPCEFIPDGLVPAIQINLVTQTRRMTVDLVNKATGNITVPFFYTNSSMPWKADNGAYWNATDFDKNFVPPGEYFWRVTTQLLNADSDTAKDKDVWESAYWTLAYSANSTGLPSHKSEGSQSSLVMGQSNTGNSAILF